MASASDPSARLGSPYGDKVNEVSEKIENGGGKDDNVPVPLSKTFARAVAALDAPNNAADALTMLETLQIQISREAIFSSNECLDDVPTSSLELVGVDYYLAKAYLGLPTCHPTALPSNFTGSSASNGNANSTGNGNGNSSGNSAGSPTAARTKNVKRAMEHFHSYLRRCENLGEGLLLPATLKEYHALLDLEEPDRDVVGKDDPRAARPSAGQLRQTKIERYKRKKIAMEQTSHLNSLLTRRSRLQLGHEEEMDGHDLESLQRSLYISQLQMYADESLEELHSCSKEMEMLVMAQQMERGRRMNGGPLAPQHLPPNNYNNKYNNHNGNNPMSRRPMELTQITQNPHTGQLQIQRQTIANQVFRPSWNQPTMSLSELAEIERRQAMERSQNQKKAERKALSAPRRYEQLVKDGMEDDDKLVDQSARLDREWDDWKEENPRGMGNKMGDRGDRNF